ncbi:MAG: hypothetical protein Q7T83_03940 [Thermodesulfovibrionales bacterium]|nr:hypothetical protein [Thermodesulfovibrionales bacterium]
MRFIGLDAGSVSVKLVLLDKNGVKLDSHYVRHKGHPLKIAFELLKSVQLSALSPPTHPSPSRGEGKGEGEGYLISDDFSLSITGSAGRLIASVLGIEPVN